MDEKFNVWILDKSKWENPEPYFYYVFPGGHSITVCLN